ncbi:MAG: aminotransferase class I/II-fold pyridoxal phosphate-dependent enzyme [bacterium]
MNLYEHLKKELTQIKIDNLYRDFKVLSSNSGAFVEYRGNKVLQMSSNNYLGLAGDPRISEAVIKAVEKYGVGSTGSRLISGTHKLHTELEEKIAELKETEKAIIFSTGYAANVGAISALLTEKDAVYSDELNHASIIDGIKLSRTNKFIYKHRDTQDLERLIEENHKKYRFNVIISDSVFSMDGDIAPLKDIVAIKERYGAVFFLDEAHAFGIYGKKGQGLAHELGLNDKIDIQMGTLSKAAGSEGGYICGKSDIIDYLRNKSRSFVFSTAPSIPSTAASIKAVEVIGSDFGLRKKLWENIDYFRTGLNKIAIASGNPSKLPHSTDCHVEPLTRLAITKQSESAIFCIKFDNIEKTLEFSNELLEKHAIMASCIRPPTVKTPIIRLCTMTLHSKQDLDYVLEKLSF